MAIIFSINYLLYRMSGNGKTFMLKYPKPQGDVFRCLAVSDQQSKIQGGLIFKDMKHKKCIKFEKLEPESDGDFCRYIFL